MMGNDKKPRICEVLGVEVDEIFNHAGRAYMVNESGWVCRKLPNGEWIQASGVTVCMAINHPESIKRKFQWTAEDIADVKAVLQIWPDTNEITRLSCTSIRIYAQAYHILPSRMFPSLKTGEFISPGMILEAETDGKDL